MWNPNADSNAIINEFLEGYSGKAAAPIRNYIDSMREALLNDNFRLNIFGDPRDAVNNYLAPDKMIHYNRLFDKAEKAVSDDKEKLTRVKEARLPLLIAVIQIAGQIPLGQKGSFYTTDDRGNVIPKPDMKNMVEEFVASAKKAGIQRIGERAITIDDYADNFKRMFEKMEQMDQAISYKKIIIPISEPSLERKILPALRMVFLVLLNLGDSRIRMQTGWLTRETYGFHFDLGEVMSSIVLRWISSMFRLRPTGTNLYFPHL